MSVYDYWAGRNAAEAGLATERLMDKWDLAKERADNERVFRKGNKIIDELSARVCGEIKWKTQYKASVYSWEHKAKAFKKELLRIAGDTQEVRDFIERVEKEGQERYKRSYQDFLSKEPYYQEHTIK